MAMQIYNYLDADDLLIILGSWVFVAFEFSFIKNICTESKLETFDNTNTLITHTKDTTT
jgi:hypothetical protein